MKGEIRGKISWRNVFILSLMIIVGFISGIILAFYLLLKNEVIIWV